MKRPASMLSVVVAVAAFAVAGAAIGHPNAEPLTIYAASSLTDAFRSYDRAQRFNFAASNTLETQIRQGAPADLIATASPINTQRLYAAGIVEEPVTFTANRLVLIVPTSNPAGVGSVHDLRTKSVKLVVAGPNVPVGRYTRTVLARLGLSSVLSKVVSQEPDVKAVTGKVALGQGEAGFVYATDARAVSDRVTVIPIPARAQPRVRYEIAVVAKSGNKMAARAWIKRIVGAKGQAALKNAGFLPITKAKP